MILSNNRPLCAAEPNKELLTILEKLTRGEAAPEELDLLQQISEDVKAGSLCGLGKTAPYF